MAVLYVAEFNGLGVDSSGHKVSAPKWPALNQSTLDYSVSEQSLTLSGSTHFLRIHADAACHINIGTSGTSTATTSMARLAADQTEFVCVPPGGVIRVVSA